MTKDKLQSATAVPGALAAGIACLALFPTVAVAQGSFSEAARSAVNYSYDDVITADVPLETPCECHITGPDGYTDLVLKFDQPAIVAALEPVADGERRSLTLTAQTKTGQAMLGCDCVTVRKSILVHHPTAAEPRQPTAS